MNVAETIKKITREHLTQNNGVVLGQCLAAVGWVGGTVPEMTEQEGLIELSTADVSNGGVAAGLALAGRRPIYIVRYQGFQWYNAASIVNYAAKSKELWGIPCPVFVRSIAMDGGIGATATGSHHGLYMRIPGIPICAPMTPKEYESIWAYFMSHDDPLHVSEHRRSFAIDYEMEDKIHENADITLFAISSTRLNAIAAAAILEKENIKCNIIHLLWLKPFIVDERMQKAIARSTHGGLVLDGDFENGVAKSLGFDLMQKTNKNVHVLGLEERSAGIAAHLDNVAPSAEKICAYVRKIVRR